MSRMLGFLHDRVAAEGHTVEFFGADQTRSRSRLSRHIPDFPDRGNGNRTVAAALRIDLRFRRQV
jgi:hypothetical protein